MTEIISCSIPDDLKIFLTENPEISPSKVLQQRLYSMRDEEARLTERVKSYEIRVARISNKLARICSWAEEQKVVIPEDVLA
jgi:hypothetical protein